jgi:hypothetical protein
MRPGTADPPGAFRAASVALVIAAGLWALRGVYVDREWVLVHDNVINAAAWFLAVEALARGELPLWAPDMNGGEPLWPLLEALPVWEPLGLSVHGLGWMAGGTMASSHVYAVLSWHLAFSLGSLVLARVLGMRWWPSLFVFTVTFHSSLALLVLRQSNGLSLHSRYVPLALAAAVAHLRAPSWRRAFVAGLAASLALGGGYMTPYALVFCCVLALFAAGPLAGRVPWRDVGRTAPAFLSPLVLTAAPQAIAAFQWLDLFPAGRLAQPHGFRMELVRDGLMPLVGHLLSESALHVGNVALLLAARAVLTGGWGPAPPGLPARTTPRQVVARTGLFTLILALGAIELAGGQHRPFLTMRNWHFLLPYLVLSVALLAGWGLSDIQTAPSPEPPARRRRLLAAAIALCLVWQTRLYTLAPFAVGPAWADFGPGVLARCGLAAATARTVVVASLVAWSLGELVAYQRRHLPGIAKPRAPDIRRREPRYGVKPTVFTARKLAEFPVDEYAPYHKLGPAVHHERSLLLDWGRQADLDLERHWSATSHLFRLRRFQALLDGGLPRQVLLDVGGAARPVVQLFHEVEVVRSPGEALSALRALAASGTDDRTVVVEGDPGVRPLNRPSGPPAAAGTWRVLAYSAGGVTFEVRAPRPGFMYYADGYAPEWRATVDGRAVPVLAANVAFKAVPVPAGQSVVKLAYDPGAYVAAFWVRAATFAAGLLGVGVAGLALARASAGGPLGRA